MVSYVALLQIAWWTLAWPVFMYVASLCSYHGNTVNNQIINAFMCDLLASWYAESNVT